MTRSERRSYPVVSVITPTKNRRALIQETMDSLQAQTLTDWEHIIVDDGSSDGTCIAISALQQSDPRIRLLSRHGTTAGASVCRNQGLLAARADLIVFLDSDDLLDPACLERRVAVMERNADLGFAVFLMEAFVQNRGDLERQTSMDIIGSVQQRISPQHLQATDRILARFEQLVRSGPGMTWSRQRALCSLYFFVAECWLQQDRHRQALACWARCRSRRLAPAGLHRIGSLLLHLQTPGSPFRPLAGRLCHRWKGCCRLRSNPALI